MAKKAALLVSACLLGERCRYDGRASESPAVQALGKRFELVPVCPEILGGLTTPRLPAERRGLRVVRSDGADVSAAFRLGAERTLAIALDRNVVAAILKSRSPSCGVGRIYDGTFSGRLCDGDGITAERLRSAGILLFGENDDFAALNRKIETGEDRYGSS